MIIGPHRFQQLEAATGLVPQGRCRRDHWQREMSCQRRFLKARRELFRYPRRFGLCTTQGENPTCAFQRGTVSLRPESTGEFAQSFATLTNSRMHLGVFLFDAPQCVTTLKR
jgi:hypothetical protein